MIKYFKDGGENGTEAVQTLRKEQGEGEGKGKSKKGRKDGKKRKMKAGHAYAFGR